MSVMLRCSCGNELTVPDEAAEGLVSCPVCHGKIDPKTSVIHPRLDDLEPDLLLAPEGGFTTRAPDVNSTKSGDDEFLAMLDIEPLPVSQDDDFSMLADDLSKPGSAETLGISEPASLRANNPSADDDEGYAIIEEDYRLKSSPTPEGLNTSAPTSDVDDLEGAEAQPLRAESAPVTVPKSSPKRLLGDSTPNSRQPLDDLLDDEILLAPEEMPNTPATCPGCQAALKPGTVLCVACGYNIKLGKKVDSAAPTKNATHKEKKTKAKVSGAMTASGLQAKLKDPRVLIGAGGGMVVLLLVIASLFMFRGGKDPPPIATSNLPSSSQGNSVPGATPTPAPPISPAGQTPAVLAADSAQPMLLLAPTGATGRVASLVLSDDGKLLAAGDESGSAVVWDLEKGETKPTLHTGVSSPVQVSFHPDGKQLFTGFLGGGKLWDVATGSEARSFKSDGLCAARFSADGKNVLTSGPTALLNTVDLSPGGRTKTTKGNLPPGAYPVVDFAPDGKSCIVGADDGLLAAWDVTAGRPLKLLEGHTTRIVAVAVSDDGSLVLSAAGGPEYRMIGKERLLMGSRPTDFTVRLWDVGTGREKYRLHTSPSTPVTCVAFSADGKQALVVAGNVQVIDVDAKQLLTTIAVAPQGTPQPAMQPGRPMPPNEPFRLAAFSHDGKRVVTSTQSSGVHLWELPTKPEPKPLDGIADPPNLASFKPSDWMPIRPLLIAPSAAPDDKETAERLAIASKAAQVSAAKNSTIKALQKALASQPRTTESLFKMAKACQKKQLFLEAEECLRASLMADPMNEEAKQLYDELKLIGPNGMGPVAITRAWVEEVTNLEDAGLRPDPPKNTVIVSIPIEVAVIDKATKIDITSSTFTGKAGDKEAVFQGIHHRPRGEVQGVRKGMPTAAGQLQVWEAMRVEKDKRGKTIVQFLNRKSPQSEQPRGKQPTTGSTKVKLVPTDTTKVKEDYKGPYQALFAVPEGETLGEIRWEETVPIRVLAEEPKSLDKLVLDAKADKPQRLAAIEAVGVSPTLTAAQTLEKVIASGDDDLFAAARTAMRNVRRLANLIAPEYLPVPSEKRAHLAAIVLGKIDGQGIQQPSLPHFIAANTSASQVTTTNSYSFCKTLWNLNEPGKYLGRVAMFGSAPDYYKQSVLEFEFEATGPNLYLVQLKTERNATPQVQLVELWRDNKLVERRILSSSPWAASALAARLPLEPPIKPTGDEEENSKPRMDLEGLLPGALPGTFSPAMQVFPGTPTTVEATPVFGANARLLPPVERAALEELVARMPSADHSKIPSVLVELVRLEMGDAAMTKEALDAMRSSLGDTGTSLFIRLAEASAPPTALAAIAALHSAGEKSAEACRKLIDLQKGPTDIQRAAEDAVADLMTQGVIAQEGDNWRYHNQTHFPEKSKDPAKSLETTLVE